MNKVEKLKLVALIFIILSVMINLYLFYQLKIERQKNITISGANSREAESDQSPSILNSKSAQSLIDEKCIEYTANVFQTECIIDLLDRVAAEREWKQRKLETAKHPQINQYNVLGGIEDEQLKIRTWRESFEKMRDAWCNAKMTFVSGSGIPGSIATCGIEFELLAINDLNNLYYETILKNIPYSEGIPSFEPTETDIDAFIKTNKTSRGCVWYGETDCN